MKITIFVALLISGLLSGCATNPSINNLTAEQRHDVINVEIYESKPQREYQELGTITGIACSTNAYNSHGSVSKEEALEGLKIKAGLMRADAVIYTLCQNRSDTDWSNNCWASVKCIGEAVKWEN